MVRKPTAEQLARQALRDKLAADVEAFLRSGGEVKELPSYTALPIPHARAPFI